jgi:SAM-dependent methyltransferase
MTDKAYLSIVSHYEACLEKYGDTHKGVDWPKAEDVDRRYGVMLDLVRPQPSPTAPVTLLDFGCGAAHLYDFMKRRGVEHVRYSGLDLSLKFVDLCRTKHPDLDFYCVDVLTEPDELPVFDYVVMNGVFTEKRELSFEAMLAYWQSLLTVAFGKARRGVAFNAMSKQVDWEREDLFHLPLDVMADFVTKKLSRHFVVRNDYGLFEQTTYVYREEFPWRK